MGRMLCEVALDDSSKAERCLRQGSLKGAVQRRVSAAWWGRGYYDGVLTFWSGIPVKVKL